MESEVARKELLREAIFPTWKDDAGSTDLDDPDKMQEKDPLSMQIWRLYSRTKRSLPNQERMENLTWRMMAMNLKRKEREGAARCDHFLFESTRAWTDGTLVTSNCSKGSRCIPPDPRALLNCGNPLATPLALPNPMP